MQLLKNGIDLHSNLIEFVQKADKLFIFVPYIKLNALKALLEECNGCQAIFVRWDTKDLITGASDLEIYPYCKERDIALFRNKRLHLKAFIENYKRCFIGSANISSRALNFPASTNYNYELATVVENLNIEDRLYFSIIEQESLLITDNIYEQFSSQLPIKKDEFPDENDFTINLNTPEKDFLISSLPLTYNVDTLYRIYETKEFINETELNCVTHDLALYGLPFGLPIETLKERLKSAFFNHPFIKAFLKNIVEQKGIYFGEAKNWVFDNCSNVPLPCRWELRENIQILYQWIVKLGDGMYIVDRPNHSERLYVNGFLNK